MISEERLRELWEQHGLGPDLIRAVEREAYEAAARVCDPPKGTKWASENSDRYHIQDEWGRKCAAAIRQLKETS